MKSFPPSFWKRGTAAWNVAIGAEWIIDNLRKQPKHYLSLRKTAYYLEVSHKTLQRWEKENHLARIDKEGYRKTYSVTDLIRFLNRLQKYKQVPPNQIRRIGNPKKSFELLRKSHFLWDKHEKTLTPTELAKRIGCHPSTIIKAILSDECSLRKTRRTPCRWEIKRRDWNWAFGSTIYESAKVK